MSKGTELVYRVRVPEGWTLYEHVWGDETFPEWEEDKDHYLMLRSSTVVFTPTQELWQDRWHGCVTEIVAYTRTEEGVVPEV